DSERMPFDIIPLRADNERMSVDIAPLQTDSEWMPIDNALLRADIERMSVDIAPLRAGIDRMSVDIARRQAGIDPTEDDFGRAQAALFRCQVTPACCGEEAALRSAGVICRPRRRWWQRAPSKSQAMSSLSVAWLLGTDGSLMVHPLQDPGGSCTDQRLGPPAQVPDF